jgi:hypothetical protein
MHWELLLSPGSLTGGTANLERERELPGGTTFDPIQIVFWDPEIVAKTPPICQDLI